VIGGLSADGQLTGERVESGVREHGGAGRDDVEPVGQRAGIPAAQREDARTLRGVP
jgi:hypothetical protein